jgi:hypothetical protein
MRLPLLALATIVVVGVCEASSRFLVSHHYVRAAVLGVILLAMAGWWLRDALARLHGGDAIRWSRPAERAATLLLAVMPAASIVLAVWDRGRAVFLAPAWITFVILAGVFGACLALVPRVPTLLPLTAAVLAGLGLRAFDFRRLPVSSYLADMIPLVGAAVGRLLNGHDPYVVYDMPWPLPLTYMPLTWLAFVPAVVAGIDLRWTSAACELGLLALLWRIGRGGEGGRSLLLLYGAWFASTTLPSSDATNAMAVQSCALAAATVLVATRSRAAAAAVGAAAATTPLAGALAPIVAVAWWHEGGWTVLARRAAIALVVFAVLVVPWIIGNPSGFWAGPVRWFNDIDGFPRRTWDGSRAWAIVPGITGLFWMLGWERLLRPAQVVLVFGVAAVLARASRHGKGVEPVALVEAGIATMTAFVAFNVIVWPYHYQPTATLALGALACAGASSRYLQSNRIM